MLVDTVTGELREAKMLTGVDDHSRFCVIAAVMERATGRAVCLALAAALTRFGSPGEILTDNGRQFTDRFGKGGEVLFDKICRKNGITHLLTKPKSPTTTGKVERFHQTLRRELLDDADPFESLLAAQATVDDWVRHYNAQRPHQSLGTAAPVMPADRFESAPPEQDDLLPLWLPPALSPAPEPIDAEPAIPAPVSVAARWDGGPVEFDRVVPPSGNLSMAGKQFWLGTARAGMTVRFWVDCDLIHLLINGARVKTVRSHLSINDLAQLVAAGAVPAGPNPLPPLDPDTTAVELERSVSPGGIVSLAGRQILAAEILGGRQVGIRIEAATLMFFDLASRELLRTRPNPFTTDQARRLRGARPAGPPPRPANEPIRVQRRASNTGVIVVCGQKIALGRVHAYRTLTIHVSDTTLAIELDDQEVRTIRRTTTQPVRNIKANRPYQNPYVS